MAGAALRLPAADCLPLAGICDHPARARVVDTHDTSFLTRERDMSLQERVTTAEPFTLQRRNPVGETKPPGPLGIPERDRRFDGCAAGLAGIASEHSPPARSPARFLRDNPSNIQRGPGPAQGARPRHTSTSVSRVHWHQPEPELPMQVYSRDSSVMTPYGAIITRHGQLVAPGENYAAHSHTMSGSAFRSTTWSLPALSRAGISTSSRRAAC